MSRYRDVSMKVMAAGPPLFGVKRDTGRIQHHMRLLAGSYLMGQHDAKNSPMQTATLQTGRGPPGCPRILNRQCIH